MFEALRKMILPIIIIVLVFFMGMIVLQWGLDLTGSKRFAQANVAGVINGEEVSWARYQSVYNNVYQIESQAREDEIPDSRIRELEKYAWEQILADRLLTQEANRQHITVTDDDIYLFLRLSPPEFLQRAPVFQTDGQFDYQKYLELMVEPQAAPMWASIEPEVRSNLRTVKVQRLITEAVHVTEEEVRQSFLDSEEQVKVGVVNVQKGRLIASVPQATTEERQAYFNEHREDYPVDERVILSLVKADKTPTDYDWGIARTLAQEIVDSVTAGSDFAEFAKRWSDDPGSASNGGDLGWFAPGRMVKAFDSAAFVMSEGEISPPIRTDFGWHVLKHHGYREESVIPSGKTEEETVREAHVSHILIKAKASSETLDQAYNSLGEIQVVAEERGIQAAAEEFGVHIETTGPLRRSDNIAYLGGAPHIVEWAFKNEQGILSEVVDAGDSYCLVRVDQRLPAGLASFEEVETQVGQDTRNERALQMGRDTARLVWEDTQGGASLTDAAEKYDLQYEQLNPFTRSASVARLASDPKPIGAAFGLNQPGEISPPVDYSGGTVILELLEKTPADLVSFNEKRDSIHTALLDAKRQQAYFDWYNHLVASSEIENNVLAPRPVR
jgi:parvulin-like peptidyl-prolyl isomerase